jgi:hypothetical protein
VYGGLGQYTDKDTDTDADADADTGTDTIPVVSGRTPSRSSRSCAECECMLQNQVGSPLSGCSITGVCACVCVWVRNVKDHQKTKKLKPAVGELDH